MSFGDIETDDIEETEEEEDNGEPGFLAILATPPCSFGSFGSFRSFCFIRFFSRRFFSCFLINNYVMSRFIGTVSSGFTSGRCGGCNKCALGINTTSRFGEIERSIPFSTPSIFLIDIYIL